MSDQKKKVIEANKTSTGEENVFSNWFQSNVFVVVTHYGRYAPGCCCIRLKISTLWFRYCAKQIN